MIGVTSQGLVFRTAMVGEVTVEWSKIRDLHSENGFGVIAAYARAVATGATPPAFLPARPLPRLPRDEAPVRVDPCRLLQPLRHSAPQAVAVRPLRPHRRQLLLQPPTASVEPNRPEAAPHCTGACIRRHRHSWFGSRVFSGWQGNAAAGVAYVMATTSLISVTPSLTLSAPTPKLPVCGLSARERISTSWLTSARKRRMGMWRISDPTRRTLFIPGSFDETFTLHLFLVQDYFLFPAVVCAGRRHLRSQLRSKCWTFCRPMGEAWASSFTGQTAANSIYGPALDGPSRNITATRVSTHP